MLQASITVLLTWLLAGSLVWFWLYTRGALELSYAVRSRLRGVTLTGRVIVCWPRALWDFTTVPA